MECNNINNNDEYSAVPQVVQSGRKNRRNLSKKQISAGSLSNHTLNHSCTHIANGQSKIIICRAYELALSDVSCK